MSQKLTLPVLLCCLIFMIVFPQQTADCVRQTLILWYQNVLPALLPALLIVHLLLNCTVIPMHPESFCLFVGVCCGFPLGCQCVCSAVQKGQISREKGHLYAAAFNQFSPVFLSAYVSSILNLPAITVFVILYGANLLLFLPLFWLAGHKEQTYFDKPDPDPIKDYSHTFFALLDNAIIKSSDTLVKIGGYMLICSMLRTILQKMSSSKLLLVMVAGFLETTSGIAYTSTICTNADLMDLAVLFFTAFGGMCGFLQVSRSLEEAGLKNSFYLCFKLSAGILAALLFILYKCLFNLL